MVRNIHYYFEVTNERFIENSSFRRGRGRDTEDGSS